MSNDNERMILLAEIKRLQGQIDILEKNYGRIDRQVMLQSKTLSELLGRVISTTTNWPGTRTETSSRVSQGQGLADAVFSILKAMRRNI